MPAKPIRVFYNDLSGTFSATQYWKETPHPNGRGTIIVITGKKYDVTQDIARAIVEEGVTFSPKPVESEADHE